MDRQTLPHSSQRPKKPSAARTIVIVAAVTVLFCGLFAAMIVMFAGQQAGRTMTLGQVVVSAGVVVLGIILVVILIGGGVWFVGTLVGRQSRESLLRASARQTLQARYRSPVLRREREDEPRPSAGPAAETILDLTGALEAMAAPQPPAPATAPAAAAEAEPAPPGDRRILEDILAELRELNENILLNDERRAAKVRLQQDKLRRRLTGDAQAAIDAADFARADEIIEMLAEKLPGDEHIQTLRERLGEARQAVRGEEIDLVSRRVNDLMAVGAFDRAEAAAHELDLRYPNDPAATDLLDRVRREGRVFHDQRRERMYNDLARLAEARQWRRALQAARLYIQTFPDGAGADVVGAMLTTIEDNARIEEVRELRDHIRDLLERRRYAEAVEYARDVIERFPDTRAAEELSRQMDRLQELARSAPANGPQVV